jgi:hypothetical protein
MNGGIGGTGAPHLATLYDDHRRPLPVGNPFEYILREAANKRSHPKPAHVAQALPRLRDCHVKGLQAEGLFTGPLAVRGDPWERF